MLLNLSNHPSNFWPEKQQMAALKEYGEVRDLPFPNIPPEWDTDQVIDFSNVYLRKILALGPFQAVHLQGEFTYSLAMVHKFQEEDIKAIVSTTRRIVEVEKKGTKVSRFDFVRFREYPRII